MSSGTVGTVLQIGSVVASFLPVVGQLHWAIRAGILLAGSAGGAYLKRKDLSKRQEGLRQTVTSNEAGIPIVYGTARIGGLLADVRVDTGSEDDRRLAYVVAICLGSENGTGIESVEKVFFDERVGINAPLNDGTLSTQGITKYDLDTNPVLEYASHLGSTGQVADAELVATFNEWDADGAGRGVAYLALFPTFDETAWRSGVGNVTAEVRGRKVYDPRSGTWAWSNNPALCILDYLTSQGVGLGALYAERDGGSRSEIDEAAWIAAANFCDELVQVPDGQGGSTTQKRFTCDGALNTDREPGQNLQELLTSCRGRLVYEGGKFRLFITQPAIPTSFELTPDNIVGEWEFYRAGAREVPNRVSVTFVDAAGTYQPNDVVWPEAGQANGFLTNDNGFENTLELDLPFTTELYRAQQIGMVTLRERREDIGFALTAKEGALQLRVGDVVPVTHPTPGYVQQPCRVEGIGVLPNGTIRLVLVEHHDDAYSLDPQNTRDTLPGTNLPDPFTVQPPTNLALLSDATTALRTQDGQKIPQLLVTWDKSPDPYLDQYRLRYRESGASDWKVAPPPAKGDTRALITPVTDGVDYEVELSAVATTGRRSVPVTASTTAGTEPGDDIWLALSDLKAIERTPEYHDLGWIAGAGVSTIWFYVVTVEDSSTIVPGPTLFTGAGVTETVVDPDATTSFRVAVPPPGYRTIVMAIPRDSTLEVAGPAEFYELNPNQDRPDKLNGLVVEGVHEDGSVTIRVAAHSRAGSYRLAYNVGSDPALPSDADVEASGGAATGGTVQTISSYDTFTLAAGTVPRGQRIAVKAFGYLNVDGTGTNGVTDHSDPLTAAWERTKFVAPTLEIVTEDDSSDPATFTVRLKDPDGLATGLYYRTKSGADPWSARTLKSGAPTDGTQYSETVPMVEGHPSFVEFQVEYTIGGEAGIFPLASSGLDKGTIPRVLELAPRLDEDALTASAEVTGDSDLAGVKILAQVGSYPSDAAVRAAPTLTPSSGRMWSTADIGVLASGLVSGNVVHFKALGIGPNGEEATTFVTKRVEFRLIQPTLEPGTVDSLSDPAVYGVIVRDAGGQAEDLYVRKRVGGGEFGAWTLKSSAPADGVEYQESVDVVDKHPSQIQFRLDYVLAGQADKVEATSPAFDLGVVPKVTIKGTLDAASGEARAVAEGNSDVKSLKVLAVAGGAAPDKATIRASGTLVNARVATPDDFGSPLDTAQTGETVHYAALGYSELSAGGTESAEVARDVLEFKTPAPSSIQLTKLFKWTDPAGELSLGDGHTGTPSGGSYTPDAVTNGYFHTVGASGSDMTLAAPSAAQLPAGHSMLIYVHSVGTLTFSGFTRVVGGISTWTGPWAGTIVRAPGGSVIAIGGW